MNGRLPSSTCGYSVRGAILSPRPIHHSTVLFPSVTSTLTFPVSAILPFTVKQFSQLWTQEARQL
jgi:hypothetical protein